MKIFFSSNCNLLIILILYFFFGATHIYAETGTCYLRKSPCFLKRMRCPTQCPSRSIPSAKNKVCYINCYSPICKAECRSRKPNCNSPGAACLDPRFIGGDGIVFYFHGKRNEYFSLVSDRNLQINARFIGLRPPGRTRDNTWIQALGLLFNTQTFTVEATRASTWNDEIDLLRFSHNGNDLLIPEGHLSVWRSPKNDIQIERIASKNSVLINIAENVEISINVVPVTKEDNKIHNYQLPSDNCFAHLEVQFRFSGLSSEVEGVLGRTYQPDFENPAKPGVAMAVVGGEDRYNTTSLLASDCSSCKFSPDGVVAREGSMVMEYTNTA